MWKILIKQLKSLLVLQKGDISRFLTQLLICSNLFLHIYGFVIIKMTYCFSNRKKKQGIFFLNIQKNLEKSFSIMLIFSIFWQNILMQYLLDYIGKKQSDIK